MTVTDAHAPARSTHELSVGGDWLAIDEFIAGVLRRAHQSAQALRVPNAAHTILHVAHMFADDLARTEGLEFERLRFIEAVTEHSSHA